MTPEGVRTAHAARPPAAPEQKSGTSSWRPQGMPGTKRQSRLAWRQSGARIDRGSIRQSTAYSATPKSGHADRNKGRFKLERGSVRVYARRVSRDVGLVCEQLKLRHDEAKSHQSDAGANPCEKRSLFRDRSDASVWIISSSWARNICAESCEPMLVITMKSERIVHWTEMRRSRARLSELETSVHARSLADFITNMFGFRFSVHTAGLHMLGLVHRVPFTS
jgi:hypothetical protein